MRGLRLAIILKCAGRIARSMPLMLLGDVFLKSVMFNRIGMADLNRGCLDSQCWMAVNCNQLIKVHRPFLTRRIYD